MPVVDFVVEDGIGQATLNRPAVKNAVNAALAEELAGAFAECSRRDDVRAMLIVGAGSTFCAGMDLKAFAAGEHIPTEGLPMACPIQGLIDKPVIAAVEGYALGAGFELALACDLIVAAESARFGLSEVKRGLVAGGGGLLRLARQAQPRFAAELVLTGKMVEAATLAECGLINRVVSTGAALDEAKAIARVIATNAPMAVKVSLKILRESADWPMTEMFSRQDLLVGPVFASDDAREGSLAFSEKRVPVWTGH